MPMLIPGTMLLSSFLLFGPPEDGAAEAESAGEAGSEPAAQTDADVEAETQPDPSTAVAPPETAGPAKFRAKEWQLQLAPGAELFVFPWFGIEANNGLIAAGPAVKFGAFKLGWYGNFMVGGGPSIHYGFMQETKDPPDRLHWLTFNGDFMIGGGRYQKFAVYAHMMAGVGIIAGFDADTNTSIPVLPGARALVGIGGYGHITPRFSIGALVDFGFPGTVDALVTATVHFGKEKKG